MIIQEIYYPRSKAQCIKNTKEGKRSINGRGTTEACDIVLLIPNNNLMSIIILRIII